jgi:threonine/homoserine/homoserine lactone efflux protein
MCIQRSLNHGGRVGFASGLGAALADACYGAIGALGVGAVTGFLVALADPLAVGGAGFLIWMAWGIWRSAVTTRAAEVKAQPPKVTLAWAFVSVFGLTLTNPSTILAFVAVFAALAGSATSGASATGGGVAGSGAAVAWMVLGVLVGSALWWLGLALAVSRFRHRIDEAAMAWINRLSASCLVMMALWQLALVWHRHGG